MATNSHALIFCEDGSVLRTEINQFYQAYQDSCESYGGGGSKFYGGIAKVANCKDSYGFEYESVDLSTYWQITANCNTCSSQEMLKEEQDVHDSCAAYCKLSNYQCSLENGEWGGSFGTLPHCSKIDSILTGCKEETSSSSVAGSSSSGEDFSSLRKEWKFGKKMFHVKHPKNSK